MLTVTRLTRKVDIALLKDMKVYGAISDLATSGVEGICLSDKRYPQNDQYQPSRLYSEKYLISIRSSSNL